jgi:hypothetical protein
MFVVLGQIAKIAEALNRPPNWGVHNISAL